MKAQRWRLRKTISRQVSFRAITSEDMKYLWAAYRKGALSSMFTDQNMNSDEFRRAFEEASSTYSEGWVIEAHTKSGYHPASVVFAKSDPLLPFVIIAGIAWFPWATKRNVIEGTVAFFNELRKHVHWMGAASAEHKRLYEVCCMHGIMRRVGTSCVAISGSSSAIFESRGLDK